MLSIYLEIRQNTGNLVYLAGEWKGTINSLFLLRWGLLPPRDRQAIYNQ